LYKKTFFLHYRIDIHTFWPKILVESIYTYCISTKGLDYMKKLLMIPLALYCASSMAIEINVSVNTCGFAGGMSGALCTAMKAEIEKVVQADLPKVSIDKYAVGLANANGFAYKGLGSDYSDVFTYAMVRGGIGGAVQGDLDDVEQAEGVGIGAAATIGLNLDVLPVDKIGPIELDKMDLFVSFMSQNMDQTEDKTTFNGDISSFGFMARYRLVDAVDFVPGNILRFGGVFLHTGLQTSSFEADITTTFDDEVVNAGGQTATFTNANAKFSLETSTTTIPVEVSAYLRTIWALTFFGGAGFDFVSGTTDVDLTASGSVVQGATYDASLSASESGSGDADATNFRAFGGVQLNIPFVRVYAHINKGLGNDLFGANAGVKFLW
jgi:hypothetical protein